MATDTAATPYKAKLIADFVASHHARLRDAGEKRPLMVSMQGPQGCGKSTLAAALTQMVESQYGLKIAVASLDGLKELAGRYPNNALLSGRGPPGTHDAPLLASTLTAVRDINSSGGSVQLPIFDKSLNGGYGDRSTSTVAVSAPIDVFLLEGWSLGFEPVDPTDTETLNRLHRAGRVASKQSASSIEQINGNLAAFAKQVHASFDVHVAVRPQSYDYVYAWRLEQEHNMKKANGGKGMTDAEVEAFVDRYMPCYELYGEQTVDRPSLVLQYGRNREVVSVDST